MIPAAGSMTSTTSSITRISSRWRGNGCRGNKGARTAGVDRVIPAFIADDADIVAFLADTREQLKARTFTPLPVRERMIPKPAAGKLRRLGIPDRDGQARASLPRAGPGTDLRGGLQAGQLRLPPERRAQDAIAEIHYFGSKGYHWVLEADIEACFDEIAHSRSPGSGAPTRRRQACSGPGQGVPEGGHHVRGRRDQGHEHRHPPGRHRSRRCWPTSPCRCWMSTSAPSGTPTARRAGATAHRKRGGATYRIVRYADDFVIMVSGSRAHADALWEEVAAVLAPLGLRLSAAKSRVCHLDEGFDFLGFHIQRRRKRGTSEDDVYTYPSKKALASITGKVRAVTNTEHDIARSPTCCASSTRCCGDGATTSGSGSSTATFHYLDPFVWRRVTVWLRKRAPRDRLEDSATPLPDRRARLAARRGRDRAVRPPAGEGHPVPLAGLQHPNTMDEHRDGLSRAAQRESVERRMRERRTSGAEGGPGKRTGQQGRHRAPVRPLLHRSVCRSGG